MLHYPANITDIPSLVHAAIDKIPKLEDSYKERLMQILSRHLDFLVTKVPTMPFITEVQTFVIKRQHVLRLYRHLCKNLMHFIYEHIWKPRCGDTIEWERQHAITETRRKLSKRIQPYYTSEQTQERNTDPVKLVK